MTATLNRVQLIGHIGAQPKLMTNKDGQQFVSLSLATNETVKAGDKWETRAEWHKLVFFGEMTKITEHLHKGRQVYVEGNLRSISWNDANGNMHRAANIMVRNIQLLSPAKAKEENEPETNPENANEHIAQMRDMLE